MPRQRWCIDSTSRHYSKLQPNSYGEKRNACGARNPAPGRKKLLQKNEQREKRDPKHVHHAADEEQCHENPAATHTIAAMTHAEQQRADYVAAKPSQLLNEEEWRLALC